MTRDSEVASRCPHTAESQVQILLSLPVNAPVVQRLEHRKRNLITWGKVAGSMPAWRA